jgi:alpha-galactosidase
MNGHVGRLARRLWIVWVILVILSLGPGDGSSVATHPLENGVARTPPMGWDTWNTFGCDIDESLVHGIADAIVTTGMRDAGYRNVVVDDCWFDPVRDRSGDLRGSPTRFPSGMKALGDYLHARGLKFGVYEVPAAKTCAQYGGAYPGATGSGGHEVQDARRFASWGVDYLKYDWCSPDGSVQDQVEAFARMRDALAATGRPVVLSVNPNSLHATTGPQRYWGDVANLWRTTQDIGDVWDAGHADGFPMGIRNIVDANVPLAPLAAPGGFNDPDMLEVGRGGLTPTEMRSHFALWAMMAAPLIAGNDVRHQEAPTTALLTNRALIAIDQDALGRQAEQIAGDAVSRVLVKRLSNGDMAVALFNGSTGPKTLTVNASMLGLFGHAFAVTDVWTGAVAYGSGCVSAVVPGHGTAVYRIARVT